MFDMRSELIQDYKISPELISACQDEIGLFCEGLEPEGQSVHCLMQAAKDNNEKSQTPFRDQCRAAVESLLHVVKPGEDIRSEFACLFFGNFNSFPLERLLSRRLANICSLR